MSVPKILPLRISTELHIKPAGSTEQKHKSATRGNVGNAATNGLGNTAGIAVNIATNGREKRRSPAEAQS